ALASVLATTVASTTVSSMLTSTAPVAWRAISPVSMVTVCGPHWKVLLTLLNMLMASSLGPPSKVAWRAAVVHKTRSHNPEHDAIPAALLLREGPRNAVGMTQLRSVAVAPESNKRG